MANMEMGAPVLDGLIGDAEWSGADVNEEFFIDADNSDGNIDGQNRLLIGEDEDSLYIAMDLNSDQTIDPSSEWVGIWLNTNNRSFNPQSQLGWINYLNDGVESLVVNVSTEETLEPWIDSEFTDFEHFNLEDEDIIPAIYSSYVGDSMDLAWSGTDYFTLNSTLQTGYEITQLDILFNLSNLYGELTDEFANHADRLRITLHSNLNESISSHQVIAWKPDGSLDINDPDQTIGISTDGESDTYDSMIFDVGNLTAENNFKISLLANSSLPFQAQYEALDFLFYRDELNYLDGALERPFSTIENAEIGVGFGPSALNSTDHRQFEFKIPKSELEHYDPNEELGIIVGGYGTLAFEDTDYWVYAGRNYTIDYDFSLEYLYFDMNGVESGDAISITNPEDLTYEIGQTGHNITWEVTDVSVATPKYTIYRNGTINATGSWISDTPIIVNLDPLDVGIYNFTIIATDGYGGMAEDEIIVTVRAEGTRFDPFADDPLRNVPGYPVLVFSSVVFVSIANLLWHKKRRI
ncbi:MAG: hypothetical protein ACTSWW_11870 [Promethearchaeota archaeon]